MMMGIPCTRLAASISVDVCEMNALDFLVIRMLKLCSVIACFVSRISERSFANQIETQKSGPSPFSFEKVSFENMVHQPPPEW